LLSFSGVLLLSLLLIPIIGVFVILVNKDLGVSLTNIKFIGLTASILNLFLSLIIFILFDFSLNQFQFVQEYHEISYFNFFLGIDGLSIYFVVRPLTKKFNFQFFEYIYTLFTSWFQRIGYVFWSILLRKIISYFALFLNNFINFFAEKIDEINLILFTLVPERVYKNADTDKKEIIKENKKKCGVYQWSNLLTGDSYIGSSVDLSNRLAQYYSKKYLEKTLLKGNSIICASLLKYGYSNFSLQILEYCTPDKVIEREQYYIDLYKPSYNILPIAGSTLGFKHSLGTLDKLRNHGLSLKNLEHLKNLNSYIQKDPIWKSNNKEALKRLHSDPLVRAKRIESLKKLSENLELKKNNSEALKILHAKLKGRARPEGAGIPAIQIELYDLETQTKTIYPSISETAKAIGISPRSITRYFSGDTTKPYRGKYFMKKLIFNKIKIYQIKKLKIKKKPVPLRIVTELMLCKPTNLLDIEMIRGKKHVSKVLNKIKYKFYLVGKVIYIQAFIIMLLQNYRLTLKILDTKCNHKCVEKQNAYLSSWLLKGLLPLKQWAKNIISDFFLGTGDPLSLVIGIKNLTLKLWALKFENFTKISALFNTNSKGDGVIVVQSHMLLEGSQETVVLKNKAGNTLHFIRKRPKTYGYNPYDTIHLNSRRTLVQKIFTLFLFILFLVLTTHASSYIMGDITGEFVLFSAAVPIKFYANADSKKLIILKENAGKSGVYRWVNQVNGKSYIGSAVNLSIRLRNYFNINYLLLHNMRIYKALLKYGHSKFDLEILEYCEPTQCIEREQYFMDLFHPHYNILNTAGSLLGFKHSDQSRANISKSLTGEKNPMYGKIGEMNHMFGREISEQTLAKLFKSLTGEKNPRYGKKKPEGSGSPSIKVKVLDILTGISTIYCSISEATKALKCPSSSISVYFLRKRQTPIFFLHCIRERKKNMDIYWKNWSNANKNRASRGKTLHSISLLRAKTFDYNSNNSIHLNFSTLVIRHMSTEVSKKCNINPWFLTGFSGAEWCFMVSIYKSPKSRVGWRVQPVFQIGLHPKDKELLNIIQTYFDGQGILTRLKDNCLTYRVFSLETLDKIIEHFEKYPLQTQKRGDFELFKSVVMMVKCGKHLNTEGLQEIINYRASLNNGLTPILKEAFPNFILIPRFHKIVNPQVLDPHWLSGFTAGEGCFNINIVKNSSTKTGYLVNLRFQLSQHLRNENLLKSFIDYFGCGKYYTVEGVQSRGDFVVTRLSDILNKIIPFYLNYPIMGIKAKDFQSWYEASELMFKKEHLTLEGLEKILKIKASKNNTPKTRKQ